MIRLSLPALYLIALLLPFLAALLLTQVAARLARRYDFLDHPSDHKFHAAATPYLGGMAVAVATVVAAGVASGASAKLATILMTALTLTIIGLLDDLRLVPWWSKLVLEIAGGAVLWSVGIRAGLFGVEALDLMLTILWVVAVTNAVNMLDNMDGLAAGVSAISALTFFALAAQRGDYLVAAFALAVCGAALGFLRWNFPPAKIFLGDAGSLLLGFSLAAIGLQLDLVGENGLIRTAVPVLILGVPLLDALLVMVDRVRGGRPVHRGGTDHSSHRLAAYGFSGRAVALLTYTVQIAAGAVALSLLSVTWPIALTVVIVVALVAVGTVVFLIALPRRPRRPADVELVPSEETPPR